MFRTMRCLGLIFVLALVLAAPPASAAGGRAPEELSVRGVVSALWQTLVGLLPVSGLDADSIQADDPGGTSGDPNGGPIMDPNGKPAGP